MSPIIALIAFLGGVVPALIWVFFWLLEDRCQPEPKRYVIGTFVAGMLAVILVLPIERAATGIASNTALLFVWAALEEIFKFGAAYVAALRWRVYDEPIDAIVYMVTAALGFSALENMLFLWTPLQNGEVFRTIVTGDLRFIGATLLHVLTSATVGIALALSFYKDASARRLYALVGVILAITLHTLFNFLILEQQGSATFWIFLCIWLGIIASLLFTEKIKQPQQDYC